MYTIFQFIKFKLFRLNNVILKFEKNLTFGNKVLFKKRPILNINKTAKIIIGSGCTINSDNHDYHINMFAKCKFYADRPNAIIKIGDNCRIHGTCIHAFNSVSIGDNCLIAANTTIIDANGHSLSMDNPKDRLFLSDAGRPIMIGDNVWIGANCVILGGVTIGAGSVISAGSVVKGNVPAKSIYGGNPAILLKQY